MDVEQTDDEHLRALVGGDGDVLGIVAGGAGERPPPAGSTRPTAS
ncbi:hypothetical protein [Kitasatospora griseola]